MAAPETLTTLKPIEMQAPEQMSTLIPPDFFQFRARLCEMNKWPNFSGYGFNLHADRSVENTDQYVGRVDDNSPASAAGILAGDRIVEVNGVNVESLPHRQVVNRIKEYEDRVVLLVIDADSDRFYKSHSIPVTPELINGPPKFLLDQLGAAVVEAVESTAAQMSSQVDFQPYMSGEPQHSDAQPASLNANGDVYANNAAVAPKLSLSGPEPGYERLSNIQAAIAASTPPPEPVDAFSGQPASQLLNKPQSQPQSLEQSATANSNARVNANSGSNSNGQTGKLATSTLYTNDGQAPRAAVTEASRTSLASPGRPPSGLLAPPPSNTYEQYSDINGNGGRPNEVPMDGGDSALYQQMDGQPTNNLNAQTRQPSVPHLPPPTNVLKTQPQPQPPTIRSKSKRETIKTTGGSFTEKSRKFQLL